MKLPDFIVIKGEVWGVKTMCLEHAVTHDDKGQLTGHAVGLCEAENKTLYLHNKLSKEAMKATLLHEVGHAIFHEIGFNQTSFSSDFEEMIVENFANVFNKILKNISFERPRLAKVKPKRKKK